MELDGFSGVMLACGIVFSLANCFLGYRLQRVWIAAICFILGFVAGSVVSTHFALHMAAGVLISIVLGVLLVLVSFKLYLAGVFVFTGGLTLLLCRMLIETPWLGWTVGALAGLLIGIASVKATRIVMILISAASGGLNAGKMLFALVPGMAAGSAWIPILIGILLAIAGMAFQFATTKNQPRAAKPTAEQKDN